MTKELGAYSAGLYIRLSREDDGEGQSESVSNQLSMLTTFARENGVKVYDTYIDDGWSGTNFERPAFQRLLADIEARLVNLVITKDLSRLGRDYIGTGHYMERWFPEHRVRYISLLDGIDTGVESAANDITPFRAIMNDMYAKDISKKIGSVKHDKQRRGLFIGGKAVFGYRLSEDEKNRLVVDETAAAIVRRVFSMALEGLSCRGIAETLNGEKIPTPALYAGLPSGRGLWSSETISALLRNETYTGSMVQGRTRRVSYKSKKCVRQPQAAWAVVPGTHEAIVDAETFAHVGRLLDARRTTRERTHPFLLKGLIFCRECGAPLGVVARRDTSGEETLYFICRTYQRTGRNGPCTCHAAREAAATDAVLKTVHAACGPWLSAETLLPEAQSALTASQEKRRAAKKDTGLSAKLEAVTAQMDRAYRDKLNGVLEERDFTRVYQKLREERSTLERAISQPQTREEPALYAEMLAEDFTASALRGELLFSLVEKVELSENRCLTIHFRCRNPKTDAP